MKKLLTIATAATIAATSAFALPFGVTERDLNKTGKLTFQGETFKVPNYYQWLHKKKNGVENGGEWRLKKLAYIMENMSDQSMYENVCQHVDNRAIAAFNDGDFAKENRIKDIWYAIDCDGNSG